MPWKSFPSEGVVYTAWSWSLSAIQLWPLLAFQVRPEEDIKSNFTLGESFSNQYARISFCKDFRLLRHPKKASTARHRSLVPWKSFTSEGVVYTEWSWSLSARSSDDPANFKLWPLLKPIANLAGRIFSLFRFERKRTLNQTSLLVKVFQTNIQNESRTL